MRLFILAAGVGSRLFPLTKDKPKSLIDLGDGTTLLDRQIKNAVSCDSISEVVVITGYKSEQIDKKIKQYKERIKIKTLYNPYYEISNNLMSLWVANSLMKKSDFLISNGDNLYKPGLYDKIIAEAPKSTIQITLDHKDHYDEDDMKIQFDDDNRIMRIHKDIPLKKSRAESVGLVIVKGKKKRKLFI
ncbi:MAG: NTP transferase domain-containing protein, partial [Calditrichaeota bacterium]|nr:NTP transferase domain-containing protein [Calditrichota bacterium]